MRRFGRIQKLAKDIREDYTDTTIHLLCVLKGGSAYFQDLITALRRFHDYSDHVRALHSATGSESISPAPASRVACMQSSFILCTYIYVARFPHELCARCDACSSGSRRRRRGRAMTGSRAGVVERWYSTSSSNCLPGMFNGGNTRVGRPSRLSLLKRLSDPRSVRVAPLVRPPLHGRVMTACGHVQNN